jgi:hypothetical protein
MNKITLYVSEIGDDGNDGTENAALGSVFEALNRIRDKGYESAEIFVQGTIAEVPAIKAMISITGSGLPPITLRGINRKKKGLLNAEDMERPVLFIGDNNTVTIGEHLIITGGCNKKPAEGAGGIEVVNAKLILEGGKVSGNRSEPGLAGGVFIGKGAEFIMNSGSIEKNHTVISGGGVIVIDNGKFTMFGGEIKENVGDTGGGGVHAINGGDFTMHGGRISGNKSGGSIIAIMVKGKEYPSGEGGGVFIGEGGLFTMLGGQILNNTAKAEIDQVVNGAGSGGGIEVGRYGKAVVLNGEIAGNIAVGFGGGISAKGVLEVGAGAIIHNNISGPCGGAIAALGEYSDVLIKGSYLFRNAAGQQGGAIYVADLGKCTINDGIIIKNDAGLMGNNLSITSGVFTMTGGFIAHDTGTENENNEGLKKIREDFAIEFKRDDPGNLKRRAKTDIVIKKDGKLNQSGGILQGVVDNTGTFNKTV